MKKLLLLLTVVALYFSSFAQGPKFYIESSLEFKATNGLPIPYPFVGGFLSPQFSNIDLNNDGKKDLFIFDRGGNKVLTFLNAMGPNGANWVYAPDYEMAFPKMTSWALLVDYNGDGKEDIFTASDPFTFPQGVAVYKNISTGDIPQFQLVKNQLTADQNIQGLPEAPIYWITDDISAIDDVDGDGDLDILSFDASAASITMYGNISNEKSWSLDSLNFRVYDECWGGFRESFFDRSISLGVPCFGSRYYKSGKHAGSTMLLLDIDNDNDKDLVLGDASYDELSLLINGKKDFSWPYDSMTKYDTIFPKNTTKAKIYTFPASFYVDANIGSSSKDLIIAPNVKAGGSNQNQMWLYENKGTNTMPNFQLSKKNFLQEWTIDFGSGVTPRFIDVDGDGDLDLIAAHRGDFELTFNRADRVTLFENTGTKTKAEYTHKTENYLGLINDSIRDMKPCFGDLNNDKKPDMLVGDADGRLHYYQNNSSGSSLSFAPRVKNYMKIDVGVSAVPQITDLDGDQLPDLIIGTGAGIVSYFKNKGTASAPFFDSLPTIDTLGKVFINDFYWYYITDAMGSIIDSIRTYNNVGYAAPFIGDLDGDGKRELLVGSDAGKLWLFNNIEGNINGAFTEIDTFVYNNISKDFGGINLGARIVPEVANLSDSAGSKPVVLLGNFRGGLNFLNAVRDSTKRTISVPEIVEELAVSVYPNPTKGQININRNLQQYDGSLVIRINDMLGREVFYGSLERGLATYTIDLSNQGAGIYYVYLSDGSQYRTVQRVSVIK